MSIPETLRLTDRGKAWLNVLPQECISALGYIQDKLHSLWRQGVCYPTIDRVMLPLHLVAPEEVRLVIICKEPYHNEHMATGIPVDTGGTLDTPSSKVFTDLISEYWKGVNNKNFMNCYYASGVLVINASFTSQAMPDKRYSLSHSHAPLWSRFCHPLVKYINANNIPILGLGVEARGLMRNMEHGSITYYCTFPNDDVSATQFKNTMRMLMNEYVFYRL